jgi:hypothetical protein
LGASGVWEQPRLAPLNPIQTFNRRFPKRFLRERKNMNVGKKAAIFRGLPRASYWKIAAFAGSGAEKSRVLFRTCSVTS